MENRKANRLTKNIMDKCAAVILRICSLLLVAMTIVTFVQVVMRFIFDAPFSWSEEATLMMLVWFGYLAMSVDIYHDSHAALYFIYKKLPATIRKILDVLRQSLLIVFFILLARYGYTISIINLDKLQPATRLSSSILYFPLLIVGSMMLIFSVYLLVTYIKRPISEYEKDSHKEMTIKEKACERGGSE